ncbi:MAG: metalloprotease RseP [Pseudomonadota bacterium]|jgi:regulator of sigma E protease
MTTVLAFLVTLAVLIAVHEYGHYRVAVACQVKVLRFSIGFGRVIFRRAIGRDGCEFVLSAIPLGGYVRMLDEREGTVPPTQRHRAFNQRPLWQRSAIVAAGPAANLLLAVLLYAIVQWVGVEEPKAVVASPAAGSLAERAGLRAGDWVRAVSDADGTWEEVRSLPDLRWRVTQAALQGKPLRLSVSDRDGRGSRTLRLDLDREPVREPDVGWMARVGIGAAFSEPVLGEVRAGGAAAQAGLRQGDRVWRIDGEPVADAQALRERIRASAEGMRARSSLWVVEREGRTLEFTVTPRAVQVEEAGRTRSIGRIDAYLGQPAEVVHVRRGPWEGLMHGVERTWEVSVLTVRTLARMLIGQASLSNLSGPLTIADVAGQSAERGLTHYLGFLALVSVSLGVLNLLPLPMLDGGHLMYHAFEAATGRPVPDAWLERLQRGGFVALVLLMSVALYNDVARLFGLH